MVKVTNIKKYTPIDLKLGIKSSMPNVKSTIALLILLGLISENGYSVSYTNENDTTITINESVFELLYSKISDVFKVENIDKENLKTIINRNQLFKSQIEALIVTFELCFELARFNFNDTSLAFSAERTGGRRYGKTVNFTSNLDYIELIVLDNENALFSVLLNWLGLNIQADIRAEEKLIKLLTLFSEKSFYKLVDNGNDIIFNNLSIYELLLEHDQVDITSDVESKGSLRVLPSILKDNLNSYLELKQGKVISKVENDILEGYSSRLERYLELENKKNSIENYIEPETVAEEIEETTDLEQDRVKGGDNLLFYGVPGSGKSHTIDENYGKEHMVRVVFHPDYMNTDFIGQILPTIKEDETITYEFKPGPFTKVLKQAYKDPLNMYYLVIEEINRGNAPAIFGEIFQLLDRNKDGESKYSVVNYDVSKVVYDNETTQIKLPSNLTLLATMNTSDQNVFTLDTAFQRRWNMQMILNDISGAEHKDTKIADTSVKWGVFNEVINKSILSSNANMLSSEDKRLGAYFISPHDLERDDKIESRFSEKVIKYLWDDAFKFSRDKLFDTVNMKSLEDVIIAFTSQKGNKRFDVFREEIIEQLLSESTLDDNSDADESHSTETEDN